MIFTEERIRAEQKKAEECLLDGLTYKLNGRERSLRWIKNKMDRIRRELTPAVRRPSRVRPYNDGMINPVGLPGSDDRIQALRKHYANQIVNPRQQDGESPFAINTK